MRAIGSIAAGIVLARFVRRAEGSSAPFVSALVVAVSVALVPWFRNPAIIGLFLLGVGLGSGIMTIYFQVLVSSFSSSEHRGSAMALAGLGWSFSHVSVPVFMGWMQDLYGIRIAFLVLGAIAFAYSLALPAVQRWAQRSGTFS
jgi:MFS family permease